MSDLLQNFSEVTWSVSYFRCTCRFEKNLWRKFLCSRMTQKQCSLHNYSVVAKFISCVWRACGASTYIFTRTRKGSEVTILRVNGFNEEPNRPVVVAGRHRHGPWKCKITALNFTLRQRLHQRQGVKRIARYHLPLRSPLMRAPSPPDRRLGHPGW